MIRFNLDGYVGKWEFDQFCVKKQLPFVEYVNSSG